VNQGWHTMNHILGNDANFDNDCRIALKQIKLENFVAQD